MVHIKARKTLKHEFTKPKFAPLQKSWSPQDWGFTSTKGSALSGRALGAHHFDHHQQSPHSRGTQDQPNMRENFCWHFCNSRVNKKAKKIKNVWHGFRGILKLSGRVNQGSLKLCAGFSNTVCWDFLRCKLLCLTENEKDRGMFCPHFVQLSNSVSKRTIRLFHYSLPPQFLSVKWENL